MNSNPKAGQMKKRVKEDGLIKTLVGKEELIISEKQFKEALQCVLTYLIEKNTSLAVYQTQIINNVINLESEQKLKHANTLILSIARN